MPDAWEETFWSVYGEYADRLVAYVTSRLSGRSDLNADDVCQEVWVRYYAKGRTAAAEGRSAQWIFAVARNLIIDLREKMRERTMEDIGSAADRPGRAGGISDPAVVLIERERRDLDEKSLGHCLEQLERAKPPHAQLIRLMLSGVQFAEISRRLTLDMDRCYKVKFEAVEALRRCVSERPS